MATVTFQELALAKGVIQSKWTLTGTDDGAPEAAPQFPIKSFTFTGTFGGGTVLVEESADGVLFVTSVNEQGTAVSVTAVGAAKVTTNARFIRPRASVGVTSVVVTMTAASQQ